LLLGTAEDPHALILRSEGFGENGREREKVEWYKANMLLTRQNIWFDILERCPKSRQLRTDWTILLLAASCDAEGLADGEDESLSVFVALKD